MDGRDILELAKRSLRGWVDDAAPSMGAALAFYALLSMAPLLLVALGLAGFFFDRNEAQNALIAQLSTILGDKAALGVESLLDAAGTREEGFMPAAIGLFTMLLGATTVFAELRSDLDRIWGYRPKESGGLLKALTARFFAFLMVMSIGLLLVASLLASTVLAAVGAEWFGRSPATMHALEFAISFGVVTLLFALIYKILPSRRLAWGDVWIGAAVTSVLFWAGKFLIALYISRAAVDSSFGAAGALVIVVLWVYYSAQVFFLGAEFTKEYAKRHGSRQDEAAPLLADLNAPYEAVLDRATRIARRNEPLLRP